MSDHRITIDESRGTSPEGRDEPIYAAFCTDECGWRGDWIHPSDFEGVEKGDPNLAYDGALEDGSDHLLDALLDDPDVIAFISQDDIEANVAI